MVASFGKARTSIVATVGPSMCTAEHFRAAIRAGARGFRIPLARQSQSAVELSRLAAAVAGKLGISVSIYLDVPGPKKILVVPAGYVPDTSVDIRIAILPRTLQRDLSDDGIYLLCDTSLRYFEVGDTVLLGDGEVAMSVLDVSSDWLTLRPLVGRLSVGQFGVAVPGKEGHPVGSRLLNSQMANIVGQVPNARVLLSFVEGQEQIDEARERIVAAKHGSRVDTEIWAKVETRKGVENLESIAQASDGVLLGRGDLLIDTGYVDYYRYERRVRSLLLEGPKPLMVGTQLWTASSQTWLPHRSELSYICDWISGGVHSVLLSDETTVGMDPIRSISAIYSLTERYYGLKSDR